MPNPTEKTTTSCRATTSSGKQCQAHPLAGSAYCFTHSPDHVQERAAARQRGGENRHPSINPAPFPDTDVTSARGLKTFGAALIKDAWTLPPSVDRIRALANLVSLQKDLIPLAHAEQRNEEYHEKFKHEHLADDYLRSLGYPLDDDDDPAAPEE